VSSGEYNFNLNAYAKNVKRIRIKAKIAAQERGKEAE
jgi:hypothetical protein